MINFTPKEIVLCKQIAGKYKKEIKYGDWYVNYDEEVRLKEFFGDGYREEDCIPLWTIPDCLEWLRKRDWMVVLRDSEAPQYGKYHCKCFMPNDHPNRKHYISKYAKTPLEACLKAVLVVIEEGK